jgi:hypothetical protein
VGGFSIGGKMKGPREIKFDIDHVIEEASITVDGKRYEIEFDIDAISIFYQTFKIIPLIQSLEPDPQKIAGLLYAGLIRHQPDTEATLVQSWFVPRHLTVLYEGVIDSFRLGMVEKREGDEGEAPNPLPA